MLDAPLSAGAVATGDRRDPERRDASRDRARGGSAWCGASAGASACSSIARRAGRRCWRCTDTTREPPLIRRARGARIHRRDAPDAHTIPSGPPGPALVHAPGRARDSRADRCRPGPAGRPNLTPPSPSALDSLTVRQDLDYDWLVVGSGFGGSVSALRLAEKGYRVGLLECGRRVADDDMPRSTWDLRRYFWAPRLGMHGIFRLTIFRDVAVVSGAGVGGGSLGYANTLYRAPERFYADPQWAGLEDWAAALAPHYDEAERMLGVVTVEADDPADQLLREFGARDRRRPDVRQDARRRLLRHAGRDRRRPVLRRRRAGAHRLHRVRALHGRLPAQRQEHAAQELPLAGRARRRDDHARAHGRRHPAARRGRRLGRLRGHDRAHRRLAAPRPPRAHARAASSSRPARSAPTGCSRARKLVGLAAARLRPPGRAGADELGGDPRRHAAARRART